jgi:hypothetical protein
MFISQLIKIVLVAMFIYLLFRLVTYILGIRKMVRSKMREEEKRREYARQDRFGEEGKKQVIELDKDHYKVE